MTRSIADRSSILSAEATALNVGSTVITVANFSFLCRGLIALSVGADVDLLGP